MIAEIKINKDDSDKRGKHELPKQELQIRWCAMTTLKKKGEEGIIASIG